MHDIWIESPHNLHCPRCDRRLVQQAGIQADTRLTASLHLAETSALTCPGGHGLPERHELDSHRERRGYAPVAPVAQVPPPHR